jgi:hypothetical protein
MNTLAIYLGLLLDEKTTVKNLSTKVSHTRHEKYQYSKMSVIVIGIGSRI